MAQEVVVDVAGAGEEDLATEEDETVLEEVVTIRGEIQVIPMQESCKAKMELT